MAHGFQAILDAHLNWVVLWIDIANVFNTNLRKAIFQEFQVVGDQLSQLFPFIHSFYGFRLFYSLVIIFPLEVFFLLGAHVKATRLQGLLLCQLIFKFCVILQGLSLHVFSLPLPITPIFSALPMLSPLPLAFCFLVSFYGVICPTPQMFTLGFVWFTSWVCLP